LNGIDILYAFPLSLSLSHLREGISGIPAASGGVLINLIKTPVKNPVLPHGDCSRKGNFLDIAVNLEIKRRL